MKKKILISKLFFLILLSGVVSACSPVPPQTGVEKGDDPNVDIQENRVFGDMGDTRIAQPGEAVIEGLGTFSFSPGEIKTLRPDIFQQGHFSLFDVLVHLHKNHDIGMEYHFDETMNTYVISSMHGRSGWWYSAYYDGGWPEASVFRMDHYPYKDGMFLSFVHAPQHYLDSIYQTYRDEIKRRQKNNNKLIVPEVIIRGRNTTLRFENIEVKPYGLRNDVLQPDIITAIDVILSLGETGKISHDLQWYESIGTAEIVKSYWVNRINEDKSAGRCGFVYEAGDENFRFFKGNHNHIPSDVRVINSPQYVEYFWICI